MKFKQVFFGIFLFVSLWLILSCSPESIILDSNTNLSFSSDTVLFDTVFTEIGSTTKYFTVKNTYSRGIIHIDEIFLSGGSDSNFRLNIDGQAKNSEKDIDLSPGDSLFIFVEVTVDPNGQNTPMVIQDSVVFVREGHIQDVDLVAFGQDYHLVNGEWVGGQTWTADKPYLVYNSMAVDSASTLIIEEGCQIHFHHQSSLFVLGTIKVQGTLENPVVFQGDRLEHNYDELPGQWGYIHLLAGSHDNEIDYAVIKNGIIGIQVDTFFNTTPTLKISNSIIKNMNAVGIFAQGAKIQASNCVIENCGQYALALSIGGKYQFYHCTIGNYWSFANRVTPSVLLNNYYEDIYGTINVRPIELAYFGNCIIYGNKEDELGFDYYPNTAQQFNYTFDHCLIRQSDESIDQENRFLNCLRNEDPNFVAPYDHDLQLDTLSAAKDLGDLQTAEFYPVDILGNSRLNDQKPDVGAYERIEER